VLEITERPHVLHVAQGPEYCGETYIWCECLVGDDRRPIQTGYHHDKPAGSLFEGDGLPVLLAFLAEHGVVNMIGERTISER
jgi:hypothetical protein